MTWLEEHGVSGEARHPDGRRCYGQIVAEGGGVAFYGSALGASEAEEYLGGLTWRGYGGWTFYALREWDEE